MRLEDDKETMEEREIRVIWDWLEKLDIKISKMGEELSFLKKEVEGKETNKGGGK